MSMDDATARQVRAADPGRSTWLSANAGSGKTRVLTDRVARLLLDGVPPERVLCLTYTKAAASEMQNRLFRRLGEWAMLDDTRLTAALEAMGVVRGDLTEQGLSHARTLFARAIDTPGGLKIQTIHSFCSAVLRRFPLEAGVSPAFAEMEERAQLLLMDEVLDRLAEGAGRAAVAGLAAELPGSDMRDFLRALTHKRAELGAPAATGEIFRWFGIDPRLSEADLLAMSLTGDEAALCRRLQDHLDPAHREQGRMLARLRSVAWDRPGLDDLAALERVFLVGSDAKNNPDGAKGDRFANAQVRAALGADFAPLKAFMDRLAAVRPLRRALLAARRTDAMHRFAEVFLPAYEAAKTARGWLDFDDLIERTRALLTEAGVAQWVLFRLDGGIDHILVDEAQDTAPSQWAIIAKLAEEFAGGQGARPEVMRTIFVVGDRKQSIYSFQGADPDGFDRMRTHFAGRLQAAETPLQVEELRHSFRSAPPILELVDRVCSGAAGAGVGEGVAHVAFHGDKPGRIDIWPAIEQAPDPEPPDWFDPVDLTGEDHHDVVLARRVAGAIRDILADPPLITVEKDERRAVQAGDILILVQRRKELFHRMIAEMKALDLPIMGADKIPVTEQLAVRDLTALLRFLATPEDDLSLAAVLRSPLFVWTEDDLFRLAHGRGGFLWRALLDRRDAHSATVEVLSDLRDRSDFLRPYELLERILVRHDGRRRLVARLGTEAEDGIDALLAQALAYERTAVPSLTGFLLWLDADDLDAKRDPAAAGNQIRIMTVHGAKGLEAPVVILPDCAYRQPARSGAVLLSPGDGPLLWSPPKADLPAALRPLHAARDARADEERNRLLYVAMTRAANWLIVGAAGKLDTSGAKGWYSLIREAAAEMGAATVAQFGGSGLRIQTGDWGPAEPAADRGGAARTALPGWAREAAPGGARPAALRAPSDLGGDKALAGEFGGLDEAAAMRRGRRLHLLLEHLPGLPRPAWAAQVPALLALDGAGDVDGDEAAALLEEAARVLTAPEFGAVFAPDALAEVTLTAPSATLGQPLLGVIDRLIVDEDRVLAVDFKSNAVVPDAPAGVPEGLLRQMGAYAEMLAEIYPGRRIETAILWTRAALLMPLPHEMVRNALQRAAAS